MSTDYIPKITDIQTLKNLSQLNQINLSPKYQREFVWNKEKQDHLIYSILQRWPIPSIYLIQCDENGSCKYEVLDGKQRLTTILKFVTNDLKLDDTETLSNTLSVETLFSKAPYTYQNLRNKHQVDNYQFHQYTLSGKWSSLDIEQMFTRLQNGEIHSVGEILYSKENLSIIRAIKNKFGNCCKFSKDLRKNQFYWFCKFYFCYYDLMNYKFCTDKNIKEFYSSLIENKEKETGFLEQMCIVLKSKIFQKLNRFDCIIFFIIFCTYNYGIQWTEEIFIVCKANVSRTNSIKKLFENYAREIKKNDAFVKNKTKIHDLNNLKKKKNQKRNVSAPLKKKIAANQKWKCKKCSQLLDETYQVDHILPLFKEGGNEIDNLQALCPNCHAKKTLNERNIY